MTASSELRLDEAVPLGYALVATVAAHLGVRCLAIKGPVLAAQGLRQGHSSIDVDVLVDPSRREDLLAALGELGWRSRVVSTTAHIVPFHSTSLAHAGWPVEIDLHDRFPGFLVDPRDAFEALWGRRSVVSLAGVEVTCPDVVGSAAVALLHVLRDPERRADEVQQLGQRVQNLLTGPQLHELLTLAERTGCAATIAPAVGRPAPVTEGQSEAALAWRLRTESSGMQSVGWVYELSTTSVRRWTRVLRRALLLTEPEIRLLYPDARPGPFGLWTGRARRLGVGLRALPAAVRLVVRARSAR